MKFRISRAVIAVVALVAAACAHSQTYPSKSIRLVVPWPPSGTVDILARPLAQKLSENLGQPVVIDNRPGANSIVGSEIAAHSTPDGYTLLVDNISGHAANATLYKKLPFNTLNDFAPVNLIGAVPTVIVVNPSTPAQNLKEVVTLARSQPGKLAYASFGTGSSAHLAGELFKSVAGIDLVHVPYKGGAPALADVMGGRVYMMFATLPSALGFIQSNRLRAIAIAGRHRARILPAVPTTEESGIAGLDAANWYGALFPAKTPPAVVVRMNQEINKVLKDPQTAQQFQTLGYELAGSTPQELGTRLKEETAKWGKVVRMSGAQLD